MRNYFSVALSSMVRGVNRFEAESGKDQASEASNVVADDGYLRRRDGFTSIACGAPHYMPKGSVFVILENSSSSKSDDRDGFGTYSGTAVQKIYIGTPEKFDGVSWEALTSVPGSLTESISLRVYYSKADQHGDTAWTECSAVKDKTRKRIGNYLSSLCQEGQISWHSGDLSDWTARTPAQIADASNYDATYLGDLSQLYWVRIDIVKTASPDTATNVPATLTLASPGIRAFQLQPVNGLFPVRLADRQLIVVCNDRNQTGGASNIRPYEPGSQIGIIGNENEQTEIMHYVAELTDEGLGVFGNYKWPEQESGSTGRASSATHTANTSVSDYGTASVLTKSDLTYAWLYDGGSAEPKFGQFRGAPLEQGLVCVSGSTAKILKVSSLSFSPDEHQFDHCRVRVTTKGAGSGLTLGEEREIWRTYVSGSYAYLLVYGDMSAAPVAGDTVAIISPHSRMRLKPLDGKVEELEIGVHENNGYAVGYASSGNYSRAPTGNVTNKIVNFDISKPCRWMLDSGKKYSGTYSRATKKLVLTNGAGPILEIDGERLRPLAADTTSVTAQTIAGELREQEEGEETEFDLSAKNYLREKPPYGDFIVDYRGRLVVARSDTNEVVYNWPGKPDIWPVGYIFQVRDSENNPITGMSTLYDRLIVYTATAIFECGPPNAMGYFTVRPASQGIGFTSHWAVERISTKGSSALLGPGTDGVYMYTGAEPVPVLDDWSRLLEGGVNRGRLDTAVAGVSFTKNLYFLAVPAAGSEINNRILVFDFSRKNWWVWTSAHGITSIATDYDETGNERVLFGTNTGHIQVLHSTDTDDGQTITGTARTTPIPVFGDREGSFLGVVGSYADLGQDHSEPNTLTLKTFTEQRDESNSSAAVKLNAGKGSADTTAWADSKKYGDGRFLHKRTNLPPGTKGNSVSVEITGTKRWKMRNLTLLARRLSRRGR